MGQVKKTRVQFDISQKLLGELDELVGRTDTASRAEVFRHAIHLYRKILDRDLTGQKVFVGEDQESARELLIIMPGSTPLPMTPFSMPLPGSKMPFRALLSSSRYQEPRAASGRLRASQGQRRDHAD